MDEKNLKETKSTSSAGRRDLNEALKERAVQEAQREERENAGMHLDSTQRVKVLSPSALVFKRFIRNKLAIVGTCILLFMFLFCFLCPVFYPYTQTQIFYKYDYVTNTYAGASKRTDCINVTIDPSVTVSSYVNRMLNSYIGTLEKSGKNSLDIVDDTMYTLNKRGEGIYSLEVYTGNVVATFSGTTTVGSLNPISKKVTYAGEELGADFEAAAIANVKKGSFTFGGIEYTLTKKSKTAVNIVAAGGALQYTGAALGEEFETALAEAQKSGGGTFKVGDTTYAESEADGVVSVRRIETSTTALISTLFVFDAADSSFSITDDFKAAVLQNAYSGTPFTVDGTEYKVKETATGLEVYAGSKLVVALSDFVVRDARGNDTFDSDFKLTAEEAISAMEEAGKKTTSFTYSIQKQVTEIDADGKEYIKNYTDENGENVYEDTEIQVTKSAGQYTLSCNQLRHLINLNGAPSSDHPFGTDSDGMDVLARMMYGGRVSLMVGFVVVFLETFIGIVLGGVAGYFGKWVDNLIMRLVDIFYCIPSMPILIIIGAVMDSMKFTPYVRLVWMMAVLGLLGWASVARLVRGQILSLREQEFMVATEATGLCVRKRIFRHLMPNVMPQLIVMATAGLGGVILTESTLSFLGLGVKHPLATWGTMINSVTQSNESMIKYTYIWVPVGLLICLTVVAFNFVGDGLRDAFDPKMKR